MKKTPVSPNPCPMCAGGKQVTSPSGSAYEVEMPRPCTYCDATGAARDLPIYSVVLSEEERLWGIREEMGCRVRAIARSRIAHPHSPLHPTELTWLREGLNRDCMIPRLEPQEYDALIRLLLGGMREKEVAERRKEWELRQ